MKIFRLTTLALASCGFLFTPAAHAQTGPERYLGEIIMGGWDFCPKGTTAANGDLLLIKSYEALYSLFGTQYGGNGRTTFGMPDLRGRAAVGEGQGPGLEDREMASKTSPDMVTPGTRSPIRVGRATLALKYCVVFEGQYPSRN